MNLNRNFFIRFCLFSLKEYSQAYQYLVDITIDQINLRFESMIMIV